MNKLLFAAVAAALVAGPASAKKPPQATGLELQQIQSRDFEGSYDQVFPSVVSVLQDAGYRIQSADKGSGLITGLASTKSHASFTLFVGMGRSKKAPVVYAFIEPRGQKVARVRLSFVMAKTKSSLYGMNSSDEEPITDPQVYRDAFDAIGKALFVRQGLDAPVPAAGPPLRLRIPASQTDRTDRRLAIAFQ
ncbi:MAG TPA: hypothetical protein VH331_12740 [Allosphingosinicella sp.]|jgi:hypothetical protein|nr:hypothetical protein [Allosphingosinicella sp.]